MVLEDQLKFQRKQYRAILDGLLEGCQIISREWRYLYLNPAALAQSRRSGDELIGRRMMEVYPHIEETELFARMKHCLQQQVPVQMDNAFIFPDGTKGFFQLSIEPVPEGLFILSLDITQRKQSAEQLRSNEEILRLFVEYAPAAIAMYDREMKYLAASRRFYSDYGLQEQSIIGRSHYAIFPEIPAHWREIHRRCLAGGFEKSEAEPFMRQNGEIDWVSWEIRPWYDAAGQIGGIILFSEVVTARKQMEDALVRSEQRWKFALEGAGDGIWDWDFPKGTVYYSPHWKTMLGYEAADISDNLSEWEIRIHPEDKKEVVRQLEKLLSGEEPEYSSEHRMLCKNGEYKWILDRGMVVERSGDGLPQRVIGTHTDISKLKEAQEILEIKNQTLRLLSSCNDILVHSAEEVDLLNDICRLIVDNSKYVFAWVGFPREDTDQNAIPAAYAGNCEGCLRLMKALMKRKQGTATSDPTKSVLQTGLPRVIRQTDSHPGSEIGWEQALGTGCRSSLILPLIADGRSFGALHIYSSIADAFHPDEVRILKELSDDLAYGIRSLRLQKQHHQSEQALLVAMKKTVEIISKTVELRDPYTAGHQDRVTMLADAIAKKIGLSADEIEGIHWAATVHDLGKMYVPSEILSKPSRLSAIEHDLIRTHAQAGYDILKNIEFPWPIADMVRQHHERMDGSGYPQGLTGSEIIIGAKILAVADVVEAMASHRPYRPSLGVDAALAEIEKNMDTKYERQVVNACLDVFRQGFKF